MKCRTVAKEIPAYLANELSERARSRVETHLKHCAVCTAELRALRRTDQLLGTLDEVEPRRDLVGHVMRHIEHEQETIPAFKRFLTSLRERQPQLQHAAAYILLMAALVLMAYNYQARRHSAPTHTASGVAQPSSSPSEVSLPDTEGARLAKPFLIIRRWWVTPKPVQPPPTGEPEADEYRHRLTDERLEGINDDFEDIRNGETEDHDNPLPRIEGGIRPVGTSEAPVKPANE